MNYIKDLRIQSGLPIVEQDEIPQPPVVGNKYHLAWASNRGYVWKLTQILGDVAIMHTPKTKKKLVAKVKDLREINRNIIKNAKKRLELNK